MEAIVSELSQEQENKDCIWHTKEDLGTQKQGRCHCRLGEGVQIKKRWTMGYNSFYFSNDKMMELVCEMCHSKNTQVT